MRFVISMVMLTAACILCCCGERKTEIKEMKPNVLDLSAYSQEKPKQPIHLLFIHHSTGGQLLADKGPDVGKNCIYQTHPNGGGLRRFLEQNNYLVHEASYGSFVGDKTDICNWNTTFREHMDKVLTCRHQDEFFEDGASNRVVLFKSCFPNSWVDSEGVEPGDPDKCEHTAANYRAAYRALLTHFAAHPRTLFVAFTAPPIAMTNIGKLKIFIKHVLGKSDSLSNAGKRIRSFNNWLKDNKSGWLANYPHKNVAVFDYYDVLTDSGRSNWSQYGSLGGKDSHPSAEGNAMAAKEFVPILNALVDRWEKQ